MIRQRSAAQPRVVIPRVAITCQRIMRHGPYTDGHAPAIMQEIMKQPWYGQVDPCCDNDRLMRALGSPGTVTKHGLGLAAAWALGQASSPRDERILDIAKGSPYASGQTAGTPSSIRFLLRLGAVRRGWIGPIGEHNTPSIKDWFSGFHDTDRQGNPAGIGAAILADMANRSLFDYGASDPVALYTAAAICDNWHVCIPMIGMAGGVEHRCRGAWSTGPTTDSFSTNLRGGVLVHDPAARILEPVTKKAIHALQEHVASFATIEPGVDANIGSAIEVLALASAWMPTDKPMMNLIGTAHQAGVCEDALVAMAIHSPSSHVGTPFAISLHGWTTNGSVVVSKIGRDAVFEASVVQQWPRPVAERVMRWCLQAVVSQNDEFGVCGQVVAAISEHAHAP